MMSCFRAGAPAAKLLTATLSAAIRASVSMRACRVFVSNSATLFARPASAWSSGIRFSIVLVGTFDGRAAGRASEGLGRSHPFARLSGLLTGARKQTPIGLRRIWPIGVAFPSPAWAADGHQDAARVALVGLVLFVAMLIIPWRSGGR